VIKYIGSKRALIPALGDIAQAVEAKTAVDLFTGTTRVAQEFKRRGVEVTACDVATYSEVLAQCYIEADSTVVDKQGLLEAIRELMGLPGKPGYFTKTFCEEARYFQPKNGARVDAMRDFLQGHYLDDPLFPILLTSLMLAADRVDSTTGVQMAYLKQWAPRAHNDIELRVPELIPGTGRAVRGDASDLVRDLPRTDLAYLDPPYNQHRYYTNYHVWETLVRWDAPEHYGIACKRIDSRDESTKSVFNKKREMPLALKDIVQHVKADLLVVSYNDESWITAEEMMEWLSDVGYEDVRMLAYDSKRYVGAQIGVYNPSGHKVGRVSHLRNIEYVFVAGPTEKVEAAAVAAGVHVAAASANTLF
jgi:adenine-specific DNA-methyltransferase